MSETTPSVPADRLEAFMQEAFEALGVPADDAERCSDVLIGADLRGLDTHGISRLGYYAERIRAGVTKPVTEIKVVKETGCTAVVDGQHGMGHVIAADAMQRAIDKAKQNGLGAVAVRNSTHYGYAGYYPLMAVGEDMVGLTTTNARPCVAPTFGAEPRFGTNPLAFGAPTDEACPFVFDASLAVIQRGKIEVQRRKGEDLGDGYVVDEEGNDLHDASEILERLKVGSASLLPLGGAGELRGGHKGYGIAMVLEILSAAFQGGNFLTHLAGGDKEGTWKPYGIGHFFMAFDIAAFTDPATFKKTTGDMMRELRTAKCVEGESRVWTAGEKEWTFEQERGEKGIPIIPELREELARLAEELEISGNLDMFQ